MSYCDLCESETLSTVALDDIQDNEKCTSQHFEIVTCTKCSHSHIIPFPSHSEEISTFYPKTYYAHNFNPAQKSLRKKRKGMFLEEYYKKVGSIFYPEISLLYKQMISEPPIIQNGKLCDVGCGNGEYLAEAKSFGWDVYGIELNISSVEYCVSMGFKVKMGRAEQIPFDNSEFDVVLMSHVLEHTISPTKSLWEINRILKKGGYLLLGLPNFESISVKIFGKYWGNLEVPRHIHHFTYSSLALYLKKTGFLVEKLMYPGSVFSGLRKSIKVMLKEQVNIFAIIMKAVHVLGITLYYRIRRHSYGQDAGIVILAKKL